jgi:hypothetical protein
MKTIGDLFKKKPKQWGLRGDPFLWKDMARVFRKVPLPIGDLLPAEREKGDHLRFMIEACFLTLTGCRIDSNIEQVHIERYEGGGMSSGSVSILSWRNRCIPLLIDRYLNELEKIQRKESSGKWNDSMLSVSDSKIMMNFLFDDNKGLEGNSDDNRS